MMANTINLADGGSITLPCTVSGGSPNTHSGTPYDPLFDITLTGSTATVVFPAGFDGQRILVRWYNPGDATQVTVSGNVFILGAGGNTFSASPNSDGTIGYNPSPFDVWDLSYQATVGVWIVLGGGVSVTTVPLIPIVGTPGTAPTHAIVHVPVSPFVVGTFTFLDTSVVLSDLTAIIQWNDFSGVAIAPEICTITGSVGVFDVTCPSYTPALIPTGSHTLDYQATITQISTGYSAYVVSGFIIYAS